MADNEYIKPKDFTEFQFGDILSSDLGIIRVSEGDRFDEELFPEIEDITGEINGLIGQYYFKTDYKTKKIEINIAFDSLTEYQFRRLRKVFSPSSIKNLIFGERPYKRYMAKIENPIKLSYVCFDERKKVIDEPRDGIIRKREDDRVEEREFLDNVTVGPGETVVYNLVQTPKGEVTIDGIENYIEEEGIYTFINDTEEELDVTISYLYEVFIVGWQKVTPYSYLNETQHIYKGEGTIEFICYFPLAKQSFKEIPEGFESEEWAISSGILTASERSGRAENVDIFQVNSGSRGGLIQVYNPGDFSTGFRLYLPASVVTDANGVKIAYKENSASETSIACLNLKQIVLKENSSNNYDSGVLIDTNNGLITGVLSEDIIADNYGNYSYLTSGNLYNQYIESGYFFKLEPSEFGDYSKILEIDCNTVGANKIKIFYDYLYF